MLNNDIDQIKLFLMIKIAITRSENAGWAKSAR